MLSEKDVEHEKEIPKITKEKTARKAYCQSLIENEQFVKTQLHVTKSQLAVFTKSKDHTDTHVLCRLLPIAMIGPILSGRAFELESMYGLDITISRPRTKNTCVSPLAWALGFSAVEKISTVHPVNTKKSKVSLQRTEYSCSRCKQTP